MTSKICWRCKKVIKEEASQWWLDINQKIVLVHNRCWEKLHKEKFGKEEKKSGVKNKID